MHLSSFLRGDAREGEMPPSLATHPQKQPQPQKQLQPQNNRNPKNKAWSFTQKTGHNPKLGRIKPELRKRMHDPLSQTGQWLKSIVQGHFNYYAVPGNTASLSLFRHRLLVLWWHKCSPPQPEAPDLLDQNA